MLGRFRKRIVLKRDHLSVSTVGLRTSGQHELRVEVGVPDLLEEAESFLNYVLEYLSRTKAVVRPGETMNYGYWLVKFLPGGEGTLEVWEYNPDATDFVRGAALTLHYWREQHRICAKYQAEFMPPLPDKLSVISAGVLEGLPVQAVRYPWAEPMSGWLMTTDRYDGAIESLQHHHTYHVTARRPDLAAFVALPHGYRFDLTDGERAWFDAEAAAQSST